MSRLEWALRLAPEHSGRSSQLQYWPVRLGTLMMTWRLLYSLNMSGQLPPGLQRWETGF